ncbi:MAG: hypothetical protein K5864_02915 [Bacteroidales bacterium]|nr:hypothetical protein [Bacteroidales bacterium]
MAVLIAVQGRAQTAHEVSAGGDPSVNDFKITMLSLGSGSSRFTYERAFDPRHSAEFTLGIIGMGWDWMNDTHSEGLLVKLAYKWRLLPQRGADSWLAGLYVKPEFVVTHFDYHPFNARASSAQTTFQGALLAECGYQLVLRWFVLDVYAGIGPSLGTGNDNNYFHSFMLFPEGGPLAFTAGYRVGVAF